MLHPVKLKESSVKVTVTAGSLFTTQSPIRELPKLNLWNEAVPSNERTVIEKRANRDRTFKIEAAIGFDF